MRASSVAGVDVAGVDVTLDTAGIVKLNETGGIFLFAVVAVLDFDTARADLVMHDAGVLIFNVAGVVTFNAAGVDLFDEAVVEVVFLSAFDLVARGGTAERRTPPQLPPRLPPPKFTRSCSSGTSSIVDGLRYCW